MGVPGPTWVSCWFISAVSIGLISSCSGAGWSAEDGYLAGVAVYADALAGLDGLGAERGAGDRGQAVFAAHDGRVAHDPADVGDGRGDLAEHRRPARRSQRGHQDLALLQVA